MLDLTEGVLQEFVQYATVRNLEDLPVHCKRRTTGLWRAASGPPPKLNHKRDLVRELYAAGASTPQLAIQFGVGRMVIRTLVKGLTKPGRPGQHRK